MYSSKTAMNTRTPYRMFYFLRVKDQEKYASIYNK